MARPQLISALAPLGDRFRGLLDASPEEGKVYSPLGLWLILSFLGTAAADRRVFEELLGLGADEAREEARRFLETRHGDYLAELAAWSNLPLAAEWTAGLPSGAAIGAVPNAEGLHDWARKATRGLIERYPRAEDISNAAIVIASALSVKTLWKVPFVPFPVSWRGEVVPGLTRYCAEELGERAGVARLASRDEFAFADFAGYSGTRVLLVVGDEGAAAPTVLAAADAIAATLEGDEQAILFERERLPIGSGHSWTLTEERADDPTTRVETVAFEVQSRWDLAEQVLADVCGDALTGLLASGEPAPIYEAVQVALARFHAKGFEAAALTGSTVLSMPARRSRLLRICFTRPFAFLARDADGLPWFSGWVTTPADDPPPAD